MSGTLRLSIVIPAYNAEDTLGDQLDAIAPQVVGTGVEVIVADNGSTDGTGAVVTGRARTARYLRLIDASARRGPSAARNIGASHAVGRALVFCDADDVVGDGWLRAMSDALDRHDVVGGSLDFTRLNRRSGGMGAPAAFPLSYLPGMRGAGSGNLAVAREAFLSVGGFDEDLRVGEDVDLCCRLQLAGHVLHPCDEAVVHVRLRGGVVSAFRHAHSFGAADRQLRHRYAQVSAAIEAGTWIPPMQDAPSRSEAGADQRASGAHRWKRVLRPRRIDPTAFARRLGRRIGERAGRIDRSLPQVAPPP